MSKKSKSCIAFLLAVILVFVSVPMSSIALDSGKADHSDEVSENTDITLENQELTEKTQIDEIVEITSLREESVKHFRRSNGSYEAIYYGEPVHRKDEKGVWQDIDHTLTMVKSSSAQKYTTPDARVTFSDSFKANAELVSLNENGYSISISLLDEKITANKSEGTQTKAVVNNPQKRASDAVFSTIEEAARINHQSSIVYENVKPNTNLEYVLRGNDLKENIIVNAPCESYDYQFQLRLDGLRPELDDKGNVLLCDVQSNQMIYMIPAPYMYDSVYEYSRDVSYKLTAIERDVYQLSIHANAEWINSPDRIFPVTIDPTISTVEASYDSYTTQASFYGNYGYAETMKVSNYETSYIYIAIPSLPLGATIKDASLNVSYYFDTQTGSLLAGAYQVMESWDEGSITYIDSPYVSPTCLSTVVLEASTTSTWASFPITEAIKDWYTNNGTNYGIAIKREESTIHTNATVFLEAYEAAGHDYAYININYYIILDGIYQIKNVHSEKYMQVHNKNTAVGAKISQGDNLYEDHQQFLIRYTGSGNDYTIQPLHALTMALGTTSGTDGDSVKLATYNAESDNQKFSISVNENGYYVIKNKKSNYQNALALFSGASSVTSTIYQKAYNNDDWQHWKLEFSGPESGVYALINAVTGRDCMSSKSTTSRHTIKQQKINSSLDYLVRDREIFFKITYRPDTQDFVIRSMMDNSVWIYPYKNGNDTIPWTQQNYIKPDSEISATQAWKISRAGPGVYYIWCQLSDDIKYYLTMPADGSDLTLDIDRTSATKWIFSAMPASVCEIETTSAINQIVESGDSLTLVDYAQRNTYLYYSTIIGDNHPGQLVSYTVTDISGSPTSIATMTDHLTLQTVAGKVGVVKVTYTYANGVTLSKNYYVKPTSGEYFFLQNTHLTTGIAIGYVDGNSTGATREAFTYDDTQIWERIPTQNNGYYYIRNVGTGLYLSSPDSTASGAALEMVSEATSDLQEWQFVETPSGARKIRSRNHALHNFGIYIRIRTPSDNTLAQNVYVNDASYLDEFNVIMIANDYVGDDDVQIKSSVVYHRTLEGSGFSQIDPSITVASLAEFYNGFTLIHPKIHFGTSTDRKNVAMDYLTNAEVMIINGHGSPDSIAVTDHPQKTLGSTDIYDPTNIDIYDSTNLDDDKLSNVDIVIFAGCSTGGNRCEGRCCPTHDINGQNEQVIHNCHQLGCNCCCTEDDEFNLPMSAEKAGAKVAIGWHVTQYGNYMNEWIDTFFSYMCQTDPDTGLLYTAQRAFEKTNEKVAKNGRYCGDSNKAILYGTNPNFRLSDSIVLS